MKRILSSLVLAFCALVAPAQATPSLIVQNGILMGAQNVDVAGTLYNVSFVEGSCDGLFNMCNVGSFEFTSSAMAIAAANALDTQVITDSALGNFRTTGLRMVYGCDMTGAPTTLGSACWFVTPGAESTGSGTAVAAIFTDTQFPSGAAQYGVTSGLLVDTAFSSVYNPATSGPDVVWARWTQASSTVPLPGSVLLLGLGLLGLSMRKTRASVTRG